MEWYVPKQNKIDNLDEQLKLIKEYPLGVLISSTSSYLSSATDIGVTHLPFIIKRDGDKIFLITHMAKRNDQVKQLETTGEVTVVFRSSLDSYVSASWYLRKQIDHKIVSTWDYCAVHVKGKPKILKEKEDILEIITKVTEEQESKRNVPEEDRWKISEAPEKYINGLVGNIVGLEIEIVDIKAKFKLNQDHNEKEADNLVKHYKEELGGHLGEGMAELTLKHRPAK